MVRPLYRSRQVWHALRPRVSEEDFSVIDQLLAAEAASLFRAMELRDQRHALEVTRRLSNAGVIDSDLLTAAMLHDCGKGRVPVWLRVLKVLAPSAVRFAGAPDADGWRGAAYRLTHHVAISAQRAAEAGLSGAAVRIIAGRPLPEEEWKLLLLQSADDSS